MSNNNLPKNWQLLHMSTLATVKGGKRVPKGIQFSSEPTEHPYIRVSDLKHRTVETSDLKYLTKSTFNEIANYTIHSGDVYISIAGTIGVVGTVPPELNGANLTENAAKLVFKNPRIVETEYLVWFLTSNIGQSQIDLFATKTSQPKLALERIEQIQITLPPLPVQRAIVTILSKAEAVRSKRTQARDIIVHTGLALYEDILGSLRTNPKNWLMKPLNELIQQVQRPVSTSIDDNYKQVTIRWYGKGAKVRSHGLGSERKTTRQFIVKEGDFIYSRIDGRKGAFAIAGNDVDGCIVTSDFPTFIINENLVNPAYLEAFTRLPYFWDLCAAESEGTTNRARLNERKLLDIRIPVPPKPAQERFLWAYQQHFATRDRQDATEEDVEKLFATLLNRAFTGELTAEWEAANAALIAEEVARLEQRPRLALLALVAERQQRRPDAVGITSLMKYAFLAQMRGVEFSQPSARLYNFVPYHFGPFAPELYADLDALESEGWLIVTRATDDDPAAPEQIDIQINPARADAIDNVLSELSAEERADLRDVIERYGELSHNGLLNRVYAEYPAYATKSKLRRRS